MSELDVARPGRGLWELGGRRGTSVGNDPRLYLALAVEYGTRRLTWVHDESKRCRRFLKLLATLLRRCPEERGIYVVLDNAAIHRANAVQRSLEQLEGRIQLWFLAPFYPDANRVEREWQGYDDAATALRHHARLEELFTITRVYFARRSRRCVRRPPRQPWAWKRSVPHYTTGRAGA